MIIDDHRIEQKDTKTKMDLSMLVRLIVRFFCLQWTDAQVDDLLAKLQKQPEQPPDEADDENLAELFDEIGVHDARNQTDIADLKQASRAKQTRKVVLLKAKAAELKRCRAVLAASRQRRRASAKVKPRAKAKASPEQPLLPLPAPPEQAPAPEPATFGPPPLADGVVGQADERPAREPAASSIGPAPGDHMPGERWPAMYSTPDILKVLAPEGVTISLDEPGCRWKATMLDGGMLPSFGFGPRSGRSRREALELCLDEVWSWPGMGTRHSRAFVSEVPADAWRGVLDPRDERPRKYRKLALA